MTSRNSPSSRTAVDISSRGHSSAPRSSPNSNFLRNLIFSVIIMAVCAILARIMNSGRRSVKWDMNDDLMASAEKWDMSALQKANKAYEALELLQEYRDQYKVQQPWSETNKWKLNKTRKTYEEWNIEALIAKRDRVETIIDQCTSALSMYDWEIENAQKHQRLTPEYTLIGTAGKELERELFELRRAKQLLYHDCVQRVNSIVQNLTQSMEDIGKKVEGGQTHSNFLLYDIRPLQKQQNIYNWDKNPALKLALLQDNAFKRPREERMDLNLGIRRSLERAGIADFVVRLAQDVPDEKFKEFLRDTIGLRTGSRKVEEASDHFV